MARTNTGLFGKVLQYLLVARKAFEVCICSKTPRIRKNGESFGGFGNRKVVVGREYWFE